MKELKPSELKNNLLKLQNIIDLVQEDWRDLSENQQVKRIFSMIDALNASELIDALPSELAGEIEHPYWKFVFDAQRDILRICKFVLDHNEYAMQYRYSQPTMGTTMPGENNRRRASTGIYDKVGKISIYPFSPDTGKADEDSPVPLFIENPSPYTPLFLNLFLDGAYLPRNTEEDKNYPGLRKCNGCSKFFVQTTKREKLFHSKECLARYTAKKSREEVKRIKELSEEGKSVEEINRQTGIKISRIQDILNR